jgi:hypothetical protein
MLTRESLITVVVVAVAVAIGNQHLFKVEISLLTTHLSSKTIKSVVTFLPV